MNLPRLSFRVSVFVCVCDRVSLPCVRVNKYLTLDACARDFDSAFLTSSTPRCVYVCDKKENRSSYVTVHIVSKSMHLYSIFPTAMNVTNYFVSLFPCVKLKLRFSGMSEGNKL